MNVIEDKLNLPSSNLNIIGFSNEVKAIYSNFCLRKQDKNIIFVTNTLFEANQLYQDILKIWHSVKLVINLVLVKCKYLGKKVKY